MSEKLEARLDALEAKVDENSRLTKELLAVFSTVEAGFKVLAGLGQAARWAAPILTAAAAIWALLHGKWPRMD